MVAVCEKHKKRIPRGHTYHLVKSEDCKLCALTEQEIKEYISYRKKYLW